MHRLRQPSAIAGGAALLPLCCLAPALAAPDPAADAPPSCPPPAAAARPLTFAPLVTDTAIPQPISTLAVQPSWRLRLSGSRFDTSWERHDADGYRTDLDSRLRLTYGPFPRSELYVIVHHGVQHVSGASPPSPAGPRSATSTGLLDSSLSVKYEPLTPGPRRPAVAALFTLVLPTGHHHPLDPDDLGTDELGSGAWSFVPGVNASKYLPPVILYANLWYSMATTARSTVVSDATPVTRTTRRPDRLIFNFAAEYPILGGPFTALAELNSTWEMGPILGPPSTSTPSILLRLLPALEYVPGPHLAFALGVEIDVAGRNRRADVIPVLSVIYTPWVLPRPPPACAESGE